ncbi:MAG: hypothetical protein F6J93_15355 [Oscillatoria sp. SIO1A7]|nr:hypothetical protein [Oscillatoria sp. SIO1A7]
MNASIIAAIAYGILAIVGGIIGYVKVKSKVSLISGVVSGLLLLASGIAAAQGVAWAMLLVKLVTTVLIVVFAIRLAKTRKFMPAGLMLVAGVVALGVMLFTSQLFPGIT